jgi:hypothetical protein
LGRREVRGRGRRGGFGARRRRPERRRRERREEGERSIAAGMEGVYGWVPSRGGFGRGFGGKWGTPDFGRWAECATVGAVVVSRVERAENAAARRDRDDDLTPWDHRV